MATVDGGRLVCRNTFKNSTKVFFDKNIFLSLKNGHCRGATVCRKYILKLNGILLFNKIKMTTVDGACLVQYNFQFY